MKEIKAIFIVAWHSKYNPWANKDWLDERTIVKQIADNVYNKIKSNIKTYNIWINEDISLQNKVKIINELSKKNNYTVDNSIVIEIHINAWGGTWIEVLWYTDYMPFRELWFLLVEHICKTTKLKDRWLKSWDKFYIIKNTTPLAVIIENGFIDTEKDRELLKNNINSFSDWIYNWLKEYIWFEENKTLSFEEMFNNEKNRADWLEYENKELKDRLVKIDKIIHNK